MTPSPQHCDHECVCWFAHGGMKPDGMFIHPCRIPCKHDTRSRPSPALTKIVTYICPYAGTHENNLYACTLSEVHSNCNYLVEQKQCPLKARDAAIVTATLERITPPHKQQTKTLDDGWTVDVNWLSEVKQNLSHGSSCDLEEIEDVLMALVKSLRLPSAPEQEERR